MPKAAKKLMPQETKSNPPITRRGTLSVVQSVYATAPPRHEPVGLITEQQLPINYFIPFPAPSNPEFTFVDLFAGIGGFRIPLQELNGKCVFTSEFNAHAQKSYVLNFGEIGRAHV